MVEQDKASMMKSRSELIRAAQMLLVAIEDRLDDLEWMCQRTADQVALLSAEKKGGSRTCNKMKR